MSIDVVNLSIKREDSTSSICENIKGTMEVNQNEISLPEASTLVNKDSSIHSHTASKARKKIEKKLVMLISNTKYDVIKYVGQKIFKYKLTKNESVEWDLCWQDGGVSYEALMKMMPFQKINHFPGMCALSRKNFLSKNLMRMRKVFPDDYNFFPKSWIIPSEMSEFLLYQSSSKRTKTFIIKPECLAQGKGIFLIKKPEEIKQGERFVVQRYIENPLLIEGLKFDLRIYVLLYGCSPLRIFVYSKGLSRFCTDQYEKPNIHNLKNTFIHLTNYAINKNNAKFIFNKDASECTTGHKRNLECIYKYVDSHGGNSMVLQQKINDAIIKTIITVHPMLSHIYKSCLPDDYDGGCCFEILGFDFLISKTFKPYLLEVNHSPSFTTDTPFDWSLKKDIVADTINLLNISQKKKQTYLKMDKNELHKRLFNKNRIKYSLDSRLKKRNKKIQERINFEMKNLGGYKLIYPDASFNSNSNTNKYENYEKYFSEAKNIFYRMTTASKLQMERRMKLQKMMEAKKNVPELINSSYTKRISREEYVKRKLNFTKIYYSSNESTGFNPKIEVQNENDSQVDSPLDFANTFNNLPPFLGQEHYSGIPFLNDKEKIKNLNSNIEKSSNPPTNGSLKNQRINLTNYENDENDFFPMFINSIGFQSKSKPPNAQRTIKNEGKFSEEISFINHPLNLNIKVKKNDTRLRISKNIIGEKEKDKDKKQENVSPLIISPIFHKKQI